MNRAITALAGPQSRSFMLLSIFAVALTDPTTASAFDCRKASTPTEKAICADPELKRKDNQLSRDYALFRQHFSKSGNYDCLVAEQKKRQFEWLKERDACGADKACIAAAYDKRQNQLDLFTRACFPMDSMRPECKKDAPTAPVTSPVASDASETSNAQDCTKSYKYDVQFTAKYEGGLVLEGHVPGWYIAKPIKGDDEATHAVLVKKIKPQLISGVTVDTGFDLAYQKPGDLKRTLNSYIREHGNPGNVDVDRLVHELSPYMDEHLVGWKAFNTIKGNEPRLTRSEAKLIQLANFEKKYAPAAERNFDRYNTTSLTYKELPSEVQTVLVDFVWNYGPADEIHSISNGARKATITRRNFWSMVYEGKWEELADALEKADKSVFPRTDKQEASYSRRLRGRGKLLRRALNRGWPQKAGVC